MNLFPKPSEPIIDQSGRVTRAWYNYLRTLTASELSDELAGRIDANAAAIKALQDAGIGAANVIGQSSVETTGSLADGLVVVRLSGDEVSPGARYVYGTDDDGNRGYFPIAGQIGTTGSVDKATDWAPYNYLGELQSEADLPPAATINDLYVIDGRAWVWDGADWVGIGAPTGNVSLSLVNDEDAPGNTQYYGTGPDGDKGWHGVAGAIAAEPGELSKAVGTDGVTTLGLADLPDSGGGAIRKFDRDAKGRVSGTSGATTDDLDEGATNLYFTDERAQDAVGAVVDGSGDVEIAYEASPARRLWARLSTAVSDLINSALQPGDNVSELANDAGYVDAAGAAAAALVQSVNGETGAVVLSAADVGAATEAQGVLADSATQPGDPVSSLDNDAGYLITAVRSIVAGANVTVDDTDPENPIINSTGGGGGSVTSVGLSAPTGFTVSGSPVTSSGTLALAYSAGYQGFTTTESGLIATAVQPGDLATVATSGDYNDLDNLPSIPSGTVTSVAMSVPIGFQVTGSPITGAGLLAVTYQSGFVGYTTTEQSKLSGIAPGAQVNVPTNLAQGTRTSTTVPITSSSGSAATLATATASLAGVMSSADKSKLDGVAVGATAYTDTLARAAAVANSISGGSPTIAPSQQSVSAALGGKENVIPTGTSAQFVRGDKLVSNELLGDMSVVSNLPSYNVYSPSKNVGYRFIGTINNTVDFGLGIDKWSGSSWSGMYAFQSAMLHAVADNVASSGVSYARWSQVFAATGTINTSDAREKTVPRDMTENEIACGLDIARLPCIYQWLESIAEKGEDGARLHAGPTVQAVIATMEAHDLDPFRYSFVCYDEWPEQQEVVHSWDEERDEDGSMRREAGSEVVQEYRPAGNRFGLRPSGLDAFCRRSLIADRDAMQLRIAALEQGSA